MPVQSINLFGSEVAFVWEDKSTTVIKNSRLRQLCPCAFCRGEKDVFGNKYGGEIIKKMEEITIIINPTNDVPKHILPFVVSILI